MNQATNEVTDCPNGSQKEHFKRYLKKIGSGEKTGQGLSREDSAEALRLILKSQASPAQIGAFMIAHRIRRPEPQELAGMLDAYHELGPKLHSGSQTRRPICFCMPFDGRKKTTPIYPLTALILLSAHQPVVLQGGKRMPIKYGVTTAELYKSLGLNLEGLTMQQVQTGFNKFGLALVHQPDHFPLAESLITYRDEIAKRPPLASMELIWTVHQGDHLIISGFVHPPTEERAWKALEIVGEKELFTVKGLEGGTDLPTSRPCITAGVKHQLPKRLILYPREHNCFTKDIEWNNLDNWKDLARAALHNHGPLVQPLRWNAGIYLWISGISKDINSGIAHADSIMKHGKAKEVLDRLITWRATQM